ncbi:NADH-quinone oxidoreductase subunit J [Fundidesulfovibrio soli]|uniref:NADH-quinone oxidoreductase subunit J family protein n=1 Tax=Fundidesulfovibrio soli TaxID=2922716 RepID=UPI001FAF8AC1|nr:NADH-quinone oxidoreductase subunit J [Fundidesulfovibrio soli]
MSLLGVIFYLLAGITLGGAAMAATRRNPMHAVLYLVVALLASALIFLLLGAPLPAILQVVVYAGAIMVLFLFIIMLLGLRGEAGGIGLKRAAPPVCLAGLCLAAAWSVFARDPGAKVVLSATQARPAATGAFLLEAYWPALEAVSILLFAALVAALVLCRPDRTHRDGRRGAS